MRETLVTAVRCAVRLALAVGLIASVCVGDVSAADSIPGIGPTAEPTRVATGFGFVEGPAWDGTGLLYFTDIPNAKIHAVDATGNVTVFVESAGPCNGLMFNADGELLGCSMGGGELVAWNIQTKAKHTLAAEYDGKRFNACNDLVVDAAGGVYFTDPLFGAPQPLPQGGQGVYYRAADGEVSRIVDDLPAPNGILLSRDEKTLYVLPSMSSDMLAYSVGAPGKVGESRVFCTLASGGSDGAALDELGNLYLTTDRGVEVIDEAGKSLGVIEFPEQPANCEFGGADGKTLYVTARTSLYSVPMLVKGHRYAAKKAASDGIIRIRAGLDKPYTDAAGNVWQGEEGFEGGLTITRVGAMEIESTDDDELYRSEHYSMESFSRELPNGKYQIKLHFAETYEGITGPGDRVFTFDVNGKEFKDFDVWEQAGGPARPYVETVDVDVTEGKLTITFTPQVQNPQINGIEIIPVAK